ncbi:MAG: hypothetical protein Q8N44_08035 [Rubrivivax sp.]|nr:hypothetical protein [Rubrivivax sp.]MDP3083624.1 hypothetical protein [Rubrivivax sp.]
MIHRPPFPAATAAGAAALAAALLAGGCAHIDDLADLQWQQARVAALSTRGNLMRSVDARCVESADLPASAQVVVVKHRIGRSRYLQAYPLPAGAVPAVGDAVILYPMRCVLQPAPVPPAARPPA